MFAPASSWKPRELPVPPAAATTPATPALAAAHVDLGGARALARAHIGGERAAEEAEHIVRSARSGADLSLTEERRVDGRASPPPSPHKAHDLQRHRHAGHRRRADDPLHAQRDGAHRHASGHRHERRKRARRDSSPSSASSTSGRSHSSRSSDRRRSRSHSRSRSRRRRRDEAREESRSRRSHGRRHRRDDDERRARDRHAASSSTALVASRESERHALLMEPWRYDTRGERVGPPEPYAPAFTAKVDPAHRARSAVDVARAQEVGAHTLFTAARVLSSAVRREVPEFGVLHRWAHAVDASAPRLTVARLPRAPPAPPPQAAEHTGLQATQLALLRPEVEFLAPSAAPLIELPPDLFAGSGGGGGGGIASAEYI
ncbi:hypothetical protein EON68_03820, partial [archaeon]